MAKTYPLEIERLYSDNEAFLMSRGHHNPELFRQQALTDCGLRTDKAVEGEEIEAPVHGWMRCVPREGYSNWHEPAQCPGPGAFPVTTATCFLAGPERATQAAKAKP